MIAGLYRLARPFLHALDPETAHGLAIAALKRAPIRRPKPDDPRLRIELFGRTFPNPVGLAPGFDKQAEVPDALLALGFGFVELGGVVPEPQAGNPRPRLFRLDRDRAVINRMGLNSDGLEAVAARLSARQGRPGIVGINIGPNKETSDRIADFVRAIEKLCGLVDFITVNVSSPNTPGLRDLQGEAFLDELLAQAVEARDKADDGRAKTALLLKIAPDIDLGTLDAIVAAATARAVDGLVVSNTTVARNSLIETKLASEAGGLSGRPLFTASTRLCAEAYLRLEGRLPIVGVGGIDSAETAWMKIRAGASLIEFYSALVFEGPPLIREIVHGLLWRLEAEQLSSLSSFVGRDAARIARGELLV